MAESEWIVLNRQPIREADWLFEIFSDQFGKIMAIVNQRQLTESIDVLDHCRSEILPVSGTSFGGSNYKLQIIESYAHWRSSRINQSSSDPGAALADIDQTDNNPIVQDSAFIKSACGLYVVELVQKFVPVAVPNERLFKLLSAVIDALKSQSAHDPWLRFFEYQLLVESGFGFSWQQDYCGADIEADQQYYFHPRYGFFDTRADVRQDPQMTSLTPSFRGQDLIAISQQDFTSERLKMAKIILRHAIEYQLKAPLISRQLWLA